MTRVPDPRTVENVANEATWLLRAREVAEDAAKVRRADRLAERSRKAAARKRRREVKLARKRNR